MDLPHAACSLLRPRDGGLFPRLDLAFLRFAFWGDVFVATTCSVGLFLMFYLGQSSPERYLAVFGGLCAIMVAMNPTNGSGCDDLLAQSQILLESHEEDLLKSAFPVDTFRGKFHLASPVALFIVLAIFNLFIFKATDQNNAYQTKEDNPNKRRGNAIYKICGWLMNITIVTLAIGLTFGGTNCDAFSNKLGIFEFAAGCDPAFWDRNNPTFFGEWAGLALFGIACFVKGRGGGFLLLDETPNQIVSRPSWWRVT